MGQGLGKGVKSPMKELTIVSGKGGTGKTSIVASFARLAKNKVLVDADVDAADLHLVLPSTIQHEENFKGGSKASINLDICTECNECIERCQFDAISEDFIIDQLECEGCGVCVHFCPVDAIEFPRRICGKWFVSDTAEGPMVHARLGIAEENSGLLVSLVRQKAKELAEDQELETIIIDGPPGIGCPVIAATTGVNAVLIVTEPTLSGMHDLKRVGELAEFLKIPAMICINKYDLNPEISDQIINLGIEHNMEFLGKIPYDQDVTYAMVAGKSLVEYSNGSAAKAVKELWKKVESFLLQAENCEALRCQECQAHRLV
ncbi:(4Fe-4S)-binding protein [Candidatus Magnetomoraceae bacterium gMMP-15]